jgi:hypothetical protein
MQIAVGPSPVLIARRWSDRNKLDLQALEQEMGFDIETTRRWWHRLMRR